MPNKPGLARQPCELGRDARVGRGFSEALRSDALDLLRAGATVVAVGTESFRDPAAGARIASELAALSREAGFVGHD